MHIHILGICGTFMGGIAALARAAGHRVTGCDANVYPPMSDQLQALGIELIEGWSTEQLALQPDLFVVGNVVRRGNPLMEEILNRGLPYTSGPQWLGEHILAGKWVLAVAGTHGKTTTSAMLAWILDYAGLAPGFLVGGIPENFNISARLPGKPRQEQGGQSPFFVIEADEYDTAFFDKRSKFVHYRPRTAILNNLEYDHADIFPDLAAIETQFHHLVRTVPGNGRLIVNSREESLHRVLGRGCWSEAEYFGTDNGWSMGQAEANGFEVRWHGAKQGHVHWALLGEHNRMNALAALAAARHVGVPLEVGIAALAEFHNVKRRMEIKGCVRDITVYDDFAHHPTAIATTLAGLRHKVGSARILAVLEPRSNTMKLGTMKAQLPVSLSEANYVFCYGGGLDWDPAEVLAPLGATANTFTEMDQLINAIASTAIPGDHIVVMSNGGFGGIHGKLLKRLAD
ncbi:MAG: UDP-N-acetylmuramate:L-alanyl-gamma-D-glutamyl-meso-diaminopimelate ligase [Formivibrio sp.]|nr:UDP-N-acetylmuramate:L-alanyl-gamma-D-glutamyl-meso-diaminopimelate ligase [Formivibrio sp.]